jgi:tetraacyldisaccharide 4'-kinase
VQAAQHLLKLHPEVNLIVSDDGMQHKALHRDIQILVFDERGVGNGWLLPAGPLREPLPSHCPTRTLVVYNAAKPTTPLPGHVATRGLSGLVAWSPWRAGEVASAGALAALKQRSATNTVWAAAGIAQPNRFFALLAQAGIHVSPLPLPDHYDFAEGAPWPPGALVVVTEKDAVKLNDALIGHSEVWVAPLDFHLGAEFEAAFSGLLHTLPNQPTPPSHGSSTA